MVALSLSCLCTDRGPAGRGRCSAVIARVSAVIAMVWVKLLLTGVAAGRRRCR
jgi:hypothetical protein